MAIVDLDAFADGAEVVDSRAIIEAADASLYSAKRAGRNRVGQSLAVSDR